MFTKFDQWQEALAAQGLLIDPDFTKNMVAAKTGFGVEQLKTIIFNQSVSGNIDTEATIVTNTRHYEALQQLQVSLSEIRNGLDKKISGDFLAIDTRACLYHLGEITGEITNEDKLDYIFSKFCIGK